MNGGTPNHRRRTANRRALFHYDRLEPVPHFSLAEKGTGPEGQLTATPSRNRGQSGNRTSLAGRSPRKSSRYVAERLPRKADRPPIAGLSQLPPRTT